MNVDLTSVARNIRLFAFPLLLTLLSFGIALVAGSKPMESDLIGTMVFRVLEPLLAWGSLAGVLTGSVWFAFNLWQLHRWQQGNLDGGCEKCSGTMVHFNGRYGAYSKCKMCGCTRSGWH